MPNVVEVRCPVGPQRLFTKLRLGEETPRVVQPSNLMELSCSDCRLAVRRSGIEIVHILHRYNFVGELIETVAVYGDGREEALH